MCTWEEPSPAKILDSPNSSGTQVICTCEPVPGISIDTADPLPTRLEPVNPWSCPPDYRYLHYFLRHVGPLLATTKSWRCFWETVIPQCAWTSDAVRHAMVAMAASYHSLRSGVDQAIFIMERTNLAIRAFRDEPDSVDSALIMCRMFAAAAQARSDWEAAARHMTWGARILTQVGQRPNCASAIAKTVAPTFINVVIESSTALSPSPSWRR